MELNEFIENYKEVFTEIIEGSFDKKAKELYGKKALESYNKVSPNYPNASRHRRGQDAESFVDSNNFVSEIKRTADFPLEKILLFGIDEFIEKGIAEKKRITPKKVYEETEDELEGSSQNEVYNQLINTLVSQLKQAGFDMK